MLHGERITRLKTLDSKKLYQNPWVTLREDIVDTGDSSPSLFAVVEITPGVVVLPVDAQNHVILVREYRYAVAKYTEEAVNGGIESDERPEDAARRELMEEVGLSSQYWTFFGESNPGTSFVKAPMYLFVAEKVEKTQKHERLLSEKKIIRMKFDDFLDSIFATRIDHTLTGLIGLMYWVRDRV